MIFPNKGNCAQSACARGRVGIIPLAILVSFLWLAQASAEMLENGAAKDTVRILLPGTDIPCVMSRDDFASMPLTEYVTSTVWTDGVSRYGGVLLWDLLKTLSVPVENGPGSVTITGLDGYSATIPFDIITDHAPLLAFLRDDQWMRPRANGPYWLIFPYDAAPEFQVETIYALSVWQITQIEVNH